MEEVQYKTTEEIEARLKQIKTIKALIADAKKVHEEDLKIYTQRLKLRAGDYEAIQEIKDEINTLNKRFNKILLEENELRFALKFLKKESDIPESHPQPM